MDIAARVTSKGQITIPKEVREALGLTEGDQVVFSIAPCSPRPPASSPWLAQTTFRLPNEEWCGTKCGDAPG